MTENCLVDTYIHVCRKSRNTSWKNDVMEHSLSVQFSDYLLREVLVPYSIPFDADGSGEGGTGVREVLLTQPIPQK